MKKLNIIFEITIRQIRKKLSGGGGQAQANEQKEEEEEDEEEVSVSFKNVTPKQRPSFSSSSSSMLKKTRFSDVSDCLFLYFLFENI